jgi:hypothetical protein
MTQWNEVPCGWDINHRNVIEKEIVANEKAIFSNRVGITVIMPIPEALRHHQTKETEGYTNDLKIDLKGYDRLYLFYYSIELIQI